MAGAGLNWIRLPIGHWLVDVWGDEPFMTGQPVVDAFVRALSWARKYGLRVNLDLHTAPGSQNGWDHSGRRSAQVNFLNGPMGLANAERYLNYVSASDRRLALTSQVRAITQFVSQPQWRNVVCMFSPLNEPYMITTGQDVYQSLYTRIYQEVRAITGLGAGQGPMLAFGDGFVDVSTWNGFLGGADRVAMDRHSYIVFQVPQNPASPGSRVSDACAVRASYRSSYAGFGYTSAGECVNALACAQLIVQMESGHDRLRPLSRWRRLRQPIRGHLRHRPGRRHGSHRQLLRLPRLPELHRCSKGGDAPPLASLALGALALVLCVGALAVISDILSLDVAHDSNRLGRPRADSAVVVQSRPRAGLDRLRPSHRASPYLRRH